jgi:hypothetical protein
MQRKLAHRGAAGVWVIAACLAGGCTELVGPDSRPVSLRDYDSVIIEDVQLADSVPDAEMAPLLRGLLQKDLLTSEHWKQGDPFDVEAFGQFLEHYATTPGTAHDRPMPAAATQEEFRKHREEMEEELRPLLDKPRGTRPVRLRATITRLDLPGAACQLVLGGRANASCTVSVHGIDSEEPIGTADVVVSHGIPQLPVVPFAVAARAVAGLVAGGEYTRQHVYDLMAEMSREIVTALEQAKQRRASRGGDDASEGSENVTGNVGVGEDW